MSESTPQQTPLAPDDASSVDAQQRAGAALRAAREAAGRGSAELATQLKVARDKIDALEAGDWAPLHNASYARALLRAAAKALHADADAIVGLLPPMSGALPAAVTMLPSAAASRPRRAWVLRHRAWPSKPHQASTAARSPTKPWPDTW